MLEGQRIGVVVPAYHEERLIGRTLRGIPAFVDHVIVVDDASEDETSRAALAVGDPRVEVVRHARNRGVGAAIATGYARAFERGVDVAVVMAGDAQMDPDDLPRLIAPVMAGRAGYAKGNRLAWPDARARMPLTRWLGNVVLSALTRLATGAKIEDSQCGYTALSADAARSLPLDQLWPRYGYPNDLLGHLVHQGVEVVDVPVRPIYADERSGVGWRHALFVVPSVLLRVWLRRAVATPRALPTPRS